MSQKLSPSWHKLQKSIFDSLNKIFSSSASINFYHCFQFQHWPYKPGQKHIYICGQACLQAFTPSRFISTFSLIKNFTGLILDSQRCSFFMQNTLIRLRGYPGWFESSLGAYDRSYIFSCCDSYECKAPDKRRIHIIFFLFLNENICCGYSLEVPRGDASNEYHNICFHREIRKL